MNQEHWFRLGRQLTRTAGDFALLSWSASMFEYLMPLLVMREYPGTLLDRTCHAVVKRQIEYGVERGVPWGVSESAFNAKDVDLTYQYQAFGVPGLGLKRGLSDDVVVAPYATLLALQLDRAAALPTSSGSRREGALGRFGFFEALDYTPGRVPAGARRAVVKTYMAHHQGMSFVAVGNELTDRAMQRRFHADPLVAASELLLQERVPRLIKPAQPHVEEVEFVRAMREPPPPVNRSYPLADTPSPATHFLSNGRYSVMVTNAGGGYSRWGDLAVSRYREDITRDCWGQFVFIRDVGSGRMWSAAHQPVCAEADDYHCIMSADRAEFRRRDGEIETYTEVVVSPEDDVEVRRVAVTNHGRDPGHARDDLLLRGVARPAGLRPGASHVLEPVRRDRGGTGTRRRCCSRGVRAAARSRDVGGSTRSPAIRPTTASSAGRPTASASSVGFGSSREARGRPAAPDRSPARRARCSIPCALSAVRSS